MNRYQMLKENLHPKVAKSRAYRFKHSVSVSQVCSYLKRCALDRVSFDAGSIPTVILDAAVVKLSRELSVPIITKSKNIASILSMTFSAPNIYALENIPEGCHKVICYWDLNSREVPDNIHIYLALVINEKEI